MFISISPRRAHLEVDPGSVAQSREFKLRQSLPINLVSARSPPISTTSPQGEFTPVQRLFHPECCPYGRGSRCGAYMRMIGWDG